MPDLISKMVRLAWNETFTTFWLAELRKISHFSNSMPIWTTFFQIWHSYFLKKYLKLPLLPRDCRFGSKKSDPLWSQTYHPCPLSPAPAYDVVKNLGWFLAMLFSIALQIGLVVVFCVCYNRGFRFSQDKQEVTTYRDGAHTFTGTLPSKISYLTSLR